MIEGLVSASDDIEVSPDVFMCASSHLVVPDRLNPIMSEQEQRALASFNAKKRDSKADEKQRTVDLHDWPSEFSSVKEALETYNKRGLPHKIMFKVDKSNLQANGLQARFSLCCVFAHKSEKKKA